VTHEGTQFFRIAPQQIAQTEIKHFILFRIEEFERQHFGPIKKLHCALRKNLMMTFLTLPAESEALLDRVLQVIKIIFLFALSRRKLLLIRLDP
jgi:hypothetical protein